MASIGESGHASAGLATAAFQSHLAPAPVPDREELFFAVSPAASTKESWVERAANLTADDFRALADALPQMAWVAEPNGDIIWYNRRWYDYTGTTIEQMRGWGWRDVHHPDHVERVVGRISEAFRTGEPWKDTFPLRGADGEYRWFLSLAQPHRGSDGRILRWFGTNTDITERKGLERRLARHAIDLRRSNEELEQFAYVASHDLKAPLRGIENLVGWIEEDLEGSLTGDVQTNMELLKSRVRRLDSLLDDLLAYSRAGRADATMDTVDTRALVGELAVLVSPPEGFTISADASLPTIHAPRAPLTQALQNLIGNAIKHHDRPAQGHIRVEAKPSGGAVEFVVTDDGPGIPEQFRERVFGMFQTLKPRDEVEGSGMGLAIVRKLVDRQGGKVWLADGSDGRGLTVHFTWPLDGGKGRTDGFDG
ncbi:sensor histidine kinase [Methylobacterium radiotolerans]|uniref:sensor histidine kinase n=1 Tax=Methylobacterium radiotolerans TaxID=31998 RepID=UPI000A5ADDCF|nr:PAS domain-containing sensor histidine kinase [Methylobacterium radiotolerans]